MTRLLTRCCRRPATTAAEADVLDVPPPLEPQAASAKAATIPTAATGTLLLRMQ